MKYVLSLFLLLLLLVAGPAAAKQTVLVIESYHSEYPWDESYLEGLRQVLGDDHEIVTFQMDTKRVPKSEYQAKADQAMAKYEEVQPDLVILGDDNALTYLGEELDQKDVPVVFLGINSNPRSVGVNDMKNVVGVLERPLFKRSAREINDVMNGELKRVLVLFDSGTTSQAAVHYGFSGKDSIQIGSTQLDVQTIGQFDNWQEVVNGAKSSGYDALFIGLYHTLVNGDGKHVPASEVLGWTVENTPIPPFAFWDFAVGEEKAIGGLVLFGKVQGRVAGEMAQQILSGTAPSDLKKPIRIAEKGRYLFSESGLEEWNLSLPKDIQEKASLVP